MAAGGSEIELKFQLRPEDLPVLTGDPLLGEAGQHKRLEAVYFDTADRALHRAGLSLRVRRSGQRRVQTLKAGGGVGAGLFRRGEWESDVDGDTPERGVLADTPAGPLLEGALLQPVFTVSVEREIRRVALDGARFEIALDQGRVEGGERQAPILELELELLEGDPSALFRHASDLLDLAPLRLSARSKSESGYLLLDAWPPAPQKAPPPDLHPAMSVREAVQAIGRAGLAHWLLNEPLVRNDRLVEATHQARVALRRFRATLSLFRDVCDDDASTALAERMRDAGRVLGAARDLDLGFAHLVDERAAASVLDAVEARRRTAYDEVVARLNEGDLVRLPLAWSCWVETGEWMEPRDPELAARLDGPAAAFLAEVMGPRARRVLKRLRRLPQLDVEARHRLRIAIKKLRYAAEFLAPLMESAKARRRVDRLAAGAAKLQDRLGAVQDRAAQARLLAEVTGVSPVFEAPDDDALQAQAARAAKRLKRILPLLDAAGA